MGEGLDKMEAFRPEGMASRILGMGDVVGLMKDFEEVIDEETAEKDAQRMLQGQFTFDDFLNQLEMIQGMGPLQDILEKLPFFADSVGENFNVDERELGKIKAIVQSMTRDERNDPAVFQKQPKRLVRVARGSGANEKDVAELLQRFAFMRQMMGGIGQQAGLLSRIPGMKQLASARQMKNMLSAGPDFQNNPMMANLANELLQAAVAEGGGSLPPGMAGMLPPGMGGGMPGRGQPGQRGAARPVDKAKKKAQRKNERKARKKSRR